MGCIPKIDAQVTIGSDIPPEKAAILDIKSQNGGIGNKSSLSGGLLLPRVEIDTVTNINIFQGVTGIDNDEQKKRHIGLTVYNLKNDHAKNIEEGIYVWTGNRWEKSTFRHRINFFYMPSIKVPATTPGPQAEIDLYEEYKKQFKTPSVKNPSAPATIPFFVNSTDLYYYITDFDKTVFKANSMSISNDGKFNYEIENPSIDGSSYINIVFVIK